VLILDVGVRDPRRQMCVALIIDMLNRARTKPITLEYGFPALVAIFGARTLRTVLASLPNNPSTEMTKGENVAAGRGVLVNASFSSLSPLSLALSPGWF
jgi:hypothetical protein